jgi:hypothetical protein
VAELPVPDGALRPSVRTAVTERLGAVPLAPVGLALVCLVCAGANAFAGAHFIGGRGSSGAPYLLAGAVGLMLPLASAAHFARRVRREPSAVGLLMVCLALAILVAMFDYSLMAGALLHYCFANL